MGFDLSELAADAQDIFTGGLSRAVDLELSTRYGVTDPSVQYEAEPGEVAMRKGEQAAPIDNNMLLVVGAGVAAAVLFFALK